MVVLRRQQTGFRELCYNRGQWRDRSPLNRSAAEQSPTGLRDALEVRRGNSDKIDFTSAIRMGRKMNSAVTPLNKWRGVERNAIG